jgi:hypothetical protein
MKLGILTDVVEISEGCVRGNWLIGQPSRLIVTGEVIVTQLDLARNEMIRFQ